MLKRYFTAVLPGRGTSSGSTTLPNLQSRATSVSSTTNLTSEFSENVEWVATTLGDLSPVADGEIDLVFAGQVIELLWADTFAGFFIEARRVLRPGGSIVIDSTNRHVTLGVDWVYHEHTVELTVAEITELLEVAGFTPWTARNLGVL